MASRPGLPNEIGGYKEDGGFITRSDRLLRCEMTKTDYIASSPKEGEAMALAKTNSRWFVMTDCKSYSGG